MTTKTCTKCGVAKPLDRFYRRKTGKFGRRDDCKECKAARNRARYEANREKITARQRARYEANREKLNAWNRAYYEANREKITARQRARYEANREKINARRSAYRALIGTPTIDKWQEISLKHATRNGEPWSEEEDRYLINSTARGIDDALALQRTYNSVKTRRSYLRRAGVMDTLNSQVIAA